MTHFSNSVCREGGADFAVIRSTASCAPDHFGRINFAHYGGGVPCFTHGGQIATPRGLVNVEDLRQGDPVLTRDNGIQPIAWVGHRPLKASELRANPNHGPVHIAKGALGNGLPVSDLEVSPTHRVLVQSPALRAYCGANEAFVIAADLVGAPGIERRSGGRVDYVHLLFERHEVILSNGAWTESFQPSLTSLGAFHAAQRGEVLSLFPELAFISGLRAYGQARETVSVDQEPDMVAELRASLNVRRS